MSHIGHHFRLHLFKAQAALRSGGPALKGEDNLELRFDGFTNLVRAVLERAL